MTNEKNTPTTGVGVPSCKLNHSQVYTQGEQLYAHSNDEYIDQRLALIMLINSSNNMIFDRRHTIAVEDFYSESGRTLWKAIAFVAQQQVKAGKGHEPFDRTQLWDTYQAMQEFDGIGGTTTRLLVDIAAGQRVWRATYGQLDYALYCLARNRAYRAAYMIQGCAGDAANGELHDIATVAHNAEFLAVLASRALNHAGNPNRAGWEVVA
ncbi:hypothetical protein NG01_10650 [Corynebacterium diphtheriae]|uniref:hypothetical protein n=1 Tax=Corynebacterium diphtheriae TaxID=1717 RepID=UPI000246820E|nr:hypothetical protein [Corynebacterium diphtheriae]AEX77908.1 hypothetical protein CDHC03_0177 [Corynebacterium diphtheriae HC03]AEX80155.1 hypothetical protein CDHC04_0162 [Corynebacterium diphtheriae HC04]KJJ58872.1 hypothetical protein NG01_10650 [Corynebacterium diphtheriae]CAB0995917.1 hypothetical protein FRC0529_00269 [Corynebacterium diphtheriae]